MYSCYRHIRFNLDLKNGNNTEGSGFSSSKDIKITYITTTHKDSYIFSSRFL